MSIRTFFILLVIATLTSCGDSPQDAHTKNINTLEEQVETTASPQAVSELFTQYEAYLKKYPNDTENNGRYTYRAAGLAYRAANYRKAADYLQQGIEQFSASSATPQSQLLLGIIYDEYLNKPDQAKTAFQYIIDKHPNIEGAERAKLFFKPDNEKQQALIQQQQQILYDEAGNIKPRIAGNLYQKYDAYIQKYPDDATNTPNYLLKGAELLTLMNNPNDAAESYATILEKFPESPAASNAYYGLATLYDDNLNRGKDAQQLAKAFVKKYPSHPKLEDMKFFLQPENERLDSKIKTLEDVLYDEKTAKVNTIAANTLIGKYERYAKQYPKKDNAAKYLYKAGEVARSTNNARKSVALLEEMFDQYPSYEKAPQALFLAGFIYENDLRDLDKAKTVYRKFMKKYPKHELAKSVEFSLQNLGKPADEIIKSFEQNKEES